MRASNRSAIIPEVIIEMEKIFHRPWLVLSWKTLRKLKSIFNDLEMSADNIGYEYALNW